MFCRRRQQQLACLPACLPACSNQPASPQPTHAPVKHDVGVLARPDDDGLGAQGAHADRVLGGGAAGAHTVLQAIHLLAVPALEGQEVQLLAVAVGAVRALVAHQVGAAGGGAARHRSLWAGGWAAGGGWAVAASSSTAAAFC